MDFTYEVEDYVNDGTTERAISIVLFYRRLSISWQGPLSRRAQLRRDFELAFERERNRYLY